LPASGQEGLAARIHRLDLPTKALLQTLAVVGRRAGIELAREVTGEPDEELRRRLATLEATEFLYEERSRTGMEYVFKHALTQEAAYASLLADRRRVLHERAGRASGRARARAPRSPAMPRSSAIGAACSTSARHGRSSGSSHRDSKTTTARS